MSSYISKLKKKEDIDLHGYSCRDQRFRGPNGWRLTKEMRRFSVGEAGYLDYDKYNDENWYSKIYGISIEWDRFNEDDIGAKE